MGSNPAGHKKNFSVRDIWSRFYHPRLQPPGFCPRTLVLVSKQGQNLVWNRNKSHIYSSVFSIFTPSPQTFSTITGHISSPFTFPKSPATTNAPVPLALLPCAPGQDRPHAPSRAWARALHTASGEQYKVIYVRTLRMNVRTFCFTI